jgi:transposase
LKKEWEKKRKKNDVKEAFQVVSKVIFSKTSGKAFFNFPLNFSFKVTPDTIQCQ